LHLRLLRNMSQKAVAAQMGTSQPAIARIETGQKNITMDTLQRLVAVLKGRLLLSIPPSERAPRYMPLWWHVAPSTTNAPWNYVGRATFHTADTEQMMLGFERQKSNTLVGTVKLLPQESTSFTDVSNR
jgi:transcriptional regulator with XRE-family HTH domain